MAAGLALPSRPRAVRVIGSSARSSGDAAALTQNLQSFVCQQPSQALQVLEDWLQFGSAPATAKPAEGLPPPPPPRQAACQDGCTHDDGQDHYACN